MKDITNHITDYRNALIVVWNDFFLKHYSSLTECGSLDEYEQIDKLLFSGLVLKPACHLKGKSDSIDIIVQLKNSTIDVMFGDSFDGYFKWRYETSISREEVISIKYIELFEFNRYESISLPYIKCICTYRSNNVLLEEYALIKYTCCKFFI